MPKVLLLLLVLGVIFIYRDALLAWLNDNPEVNQYVPAVVTSALERDLEDWKQEDLQARVSQLKAEVEGLQTKLVEAAEQGEAKVAEVQANLNQAREALAEAKAALDKLSEAGEGLKSAVSPAE